MKMKGFALTLIMGLTWAGTVFANHENGAHVFGYTVGVAHKNDVVAAVDKVVKLHPAGVSVYSNGPIMSGIAAGTKAGADGLHEVILVFDKNDVLVSTRMMFEHRQFEGVLKELQKRYKVESAEVPAAGARFARFVDGATVINLVDLSEDVVAVVYMTQDFEKAYLAKKSVN